ncbi:MAG: winged helix-turn-helix transcriptional regulator [Micromonosporaceae bacterium]|jgi:DNA-binding FadR family transcriptional regulator|nr:winged helix-turn-helix transcriptional regulator [Micromonosporaceae bacterium]
MSGKSLRAQVIESIREKIESGVWPPGHKLPTKRELAVMHGVSIAVIDAAMIELRAAGLVRGQQGKAVYVAGGEV